MEPRRYSHLNLFIFILYIHDYRTSQRNKLISQSVQLKEYTLAEKTVRAISNARLNVSPHVHLHPINVIVSDDPQ